MSVPIDSYDRGQFVEDFDHEKVSPIGVAAIAQLLEGEDHFSMPLVHDVALDYLFEGDSKHSFMVEGIVGYTLLGDPENLKCVSTVLVSPPSAQSDDRWFLSMARSLVHEVPQPDDDSQMLDLGTRTALFETNTLILTGVVKMVSRRNRDKSYLSLIVPNVFIRDDIDPKDVGLPDIQDSYAIGTSAALFDRMSGIQLGSKKEETL